MYLYLISYDLMRPGQAYDRLIAELTRLGARRVQQSTWTWRSENTASQIWKHLVGFGLDGNDRLIVAGLDPQNLSYSSTMPKI